MENRTDQTIELETGLEYLILRQILYKNETYYVTAQIKEGGKDFSKVLTILKETKQGDDVYVNIETDINVIKTILDHLN